MTIIDRNGYGILTTNIETAPEFLKQYPYFEVENFTPEEGVLMCDSTNKTYWYVKQETPTEPVDTVQVQIQALSDQQEFLEDCIAEMAEIVYA